MLECSANGWAPKILAIAEDIHRERSISAWFFPQQQKTIKERDPVQRDFSAAFLFQKKSGTSFTRWVKAVEDDKRIAQAHG